MLDYKGERKKDRRQGKIVRDWKVIMKRSAVTATVMSSLFFVHTTVQAETVEDIQAQRSSLQSDINEKETELQKIKQELISLTEQTNRLDEAIEDNEKKITETKSEIASTEKEVEGLNETIEEKEEKIEKRNEILKDRISSMQQNGGSTSYLEVILGADNFLDFIDRFALVTKITDADQKLLEEQENDKLELEQEKSTLDDKLTELEEMKVEYEAMQKQIVAQKDQNEQLKSELQQKQDANADVLEELKIEDEVLANKQQALKEAQQRQKELEAQSSSNDASGSAGIELYASSSDNSTVSGNLQTIINAGNQYIGNSVYVFGGGRTAYDIANGRFDCSGFVSWAFRQGGVSIPSSTSALSSVGKRVSTSEMKPGDLVFFNTYKTNGHVGIYLGNNKFIGSQSSSGVAVESMSNSYWKSTFTGHVRRVIQ